MLLNLCDKLLIMTRKLSWLGPLLVRLVIGGVFVMTGWGKLHDIGKVTEFFTTLKIPMPHLNAIIVANTEFFGGICLILGLLTRLAALPLAFSMLIAIITAKLPDAAGLGDVLGFEELSYLLFFVWLALAGPGCVSVDHFLWKALRKNAPAS